MRSRLGVGLAALALFFGAVALYVYDTFMSMEVERVTDDVHVIYGLGSNVGVLRTDRGTVVVDTMSFVLQGRRILELAEKLGGGPVVAIINTHYHFDHTHGNPAFPPGTKVVSTERTLDYLEAFDASYWEDAAAGTLPNETFEREHILRIGGKTIRLHHLGRGHTGGDLVVVFAEDRAIHTGDLVFNGRYPNIDLEAGGSVREWKATLDRVLALDFDRVIPGHGPLTDRAGIVAFQSFIRELWTAAESAADAGSSLADTLASVDLATDEGYADSGVPLVMTLDRDFVVRRAWEEATGAVEATPVPRSD